MMEDETYNDLRKFIGDEVASWVGNLGLKSWTINLTFERSGFDTTEQDGSKFYARTATAWEYMDMSIEWDMPMCAKLLLTSGKDSLTDTVVHELMHGVVNEMHECGPKRREATDSDVKHEERVVTTLTNCFMVYKAYRDREAQEISSKARRNTTDSTPQRGKGKKKHN